MFGITNLHPMIVHFPIALLMTGFVAEAIGVIFKKEFFTRAAFYLLLAGTAGVVAAWFSGDAAGDGITEAGTLKTALETHQHAAQLTLWIMAGVAALRIALVAASRYKGAFQWFALAAYLVGVLSIVRTGHYGGQLVYQHGAGVELQLGFDAIDTAPPSEAAPADSQDTTATTPAD